VKEKGDVCLGYHVRLGDVVEISCGEVLQEAVGEVFLHHVRVALAKVPFLQGASERQQTGNRGATTRRSEHRQGQFVELVRVVQNRLVVFLDF
jgi:hypothetical protein